MDWSNWCLDFFWGLLQYESDPTATYQTIGTVSKNLLWFSNKIENMEVAPNKYSSQI